MQSINECLVKWIAACFKKHIHQVKIAFSSEKVLSSVSREMCIFRPWFRGDYFFKLQFISENSSKPNPWILNVRGQQGMDDLNHVDYVVYCDVFITCLNSHSDGTHLLQRIHCWCNVKFLQICSFIIYSCWFKPVWFIYSRGHKRKCFVRYFFHTKMEVSGNKNCLVTNILQFHKKENHTDLHLYNWNVSNWWQIFHFHSFILLKMIFFILLKILKRDWNVQCRTVSKFIQEL